MGRAQTTTWRSTCWTVEFWVKERIAPTCVPFNAISLQIPRPANSIHLRLFVQQVVIDAPRLGVHIDKGDPADLLVVLIWCCEVEIPS